MKKKDCLAMLLAGGQGSRLGALTKHIAKPAASFGGKYRIIDFSLSNCTNSQIDAVGVLTQYRPLLLNSYIGTGGAWDLDIPGAGVSILPPYETEDGGEWYKGTADAVYQNLDYINMHDPQYVIILSGDHLYRMNYREMLRTHQKHNAELTVSVMRVPWDEAKRFGIITADEDGKISKFSEKPKNPDSNLASMGIYIFNKDTLVRVLKEDNKDPNSSHDFGKNVIPKLLAEKRRLYCHYFEGYWKDIGTIDSFHETSMGLLEAQPEFELHSESAPVLSNADAAPPHYIGSEATLANSLVADGSIVLGNVERSILSLNSYVGVGATVKDSILMPGAKVQAGATVIRAILGEKAEVSENATLGTADEQQKIAVVGGGVVVAKAKKEAK